MNCRFCDTALEHEFVDLVTSPPSNAFLSADELDEPEVYFPLKVYVCHECWLVQMGEHKRAREIFGKEYAYFSSYSKSWLEHAERYVDDTVERFGIDGSSRVVELASNDGYLLQYFQERGVPVLGIEPAENVARVALERGVPTRIAYFSRDLAEQLVAQEGPADLVIGNNVLAHVPDLNDFVAGLGVLIARGGLGTFEFPHLMRLVEHSQFDTIYHEHFSYFSFTTISEVFAQHGLRLFDVLELDTHGGSLRVYVQQVDADPSHKATFRVDELLRRECEAGVRELGYYGGFQARVDSVKNALLTFLVGEKEAGRTVVGYGAAAKGNTLLNYCGVKRDLLPYIVDASPHKQGRFLPGSRIPVLSENAIRERQPDTVLILPWNIKAEIVQQLDYIRGWGGRFAVPVPRLELF